MVNWPPLGYQGSAWQNSQNPGLPQLAKEEKPFKGIDIYKHVRKDPFTDHTPDLTCDANSKNRYNVLAAVSLKKEAPICTRVVEEVGDSILFSEFVAAAMEEGVLVRGDILIIDNC